MTLGQRVQRLTGDELFSHLPLERDAMGTMLDHGFYFPEAQQGGKIEDLNGPLAEARAMTWKLFNAD